MVSGQLHVMATSCPKERASGFHWIGRWVGPRASLDAVAKRRNLSKKNCQSEDNNSK